MHMETFTRNKRLERHVLKWTSLRDILCDICFLGASGRCSCSTTTTVYRDDARRQPTLSGSQSGREDRSLTLTSLLRPLLLIIPGHLFFIQITFLHS